MIKNIAIVVLILMVAAVSVFSFQKASLADKSEKKAIALTNELVEMSKKAERLKKMAEEQAAKAIEAEANAMIMVKNLEDCNNGK